MEKNHLMDVSKDVYILPATKSEPQPTQRRDGETGVDSLRCLQCLAMRFLLPLEQSRRRAVGWQKEGLVAWSVGIL